MAALAVSVADNPLVLQAAASPDPSARLQPYALKVMDDADADFITIMAPDRTRWTHPRDEELGQPYIGSISDALEGRVFTEITAGTLGPSVRTIAPVKDAGGSVKALVAAGVTVRTIDVAVAGRIPALLAICRRPPRGRVHRLLAARRLSPAGNPRLGTRTACPALCLLRIRAPLGPRRRHPDRHPEDAW